MKIAVEYGKLIIDPDFQRNLVWDQEQKSQFIESIILNFPLPPFYINQRNDGKYNIVDGLQRTTTMHAFVNDQFRLQDLEALTYLNGCNFSDLKKLNSDYQTKIEDKKLTIYLIKPSVSIKVVYDIFKRINTNGTPLNRQEVRNCIFSCVVETARKLTWEIHNSYLSRGCISKCIFLHCL